MSQLMLIGSRVLCRNATGRLVAMPKRCTSTELQQSAEKFFARHAKRGSPQSPYMLGTTYKLQLTSMLSLTHRITGLGLGILVYGIGFAELSQPNLNYEQILQKMKSAVPEVLISAVKFLAGSAIAFHTINGVRHLAWDVGYGFKIPDLYKSGYAVIGLTLVAVAFMLKSALE